MANPFDFLRRIFGGRPKETEPEPTPRGAPPPLITRPVESFEAGTVRRHFYNEPGFQTYHKDWHPPSQTALLKNGPKLWTQPLLGAHSRTNNPLPRSRVRWLNVLDILRDLHIQHSAKLRYIWRDRASPIHGLPIFYPRTNPSSQECLVAS